MVVGVLLWTGASITASLLLVQVAVFPLLFRYNKALQRRMVFSTCINYPRNVNYDDPACCQVVGGKSFRVHFSSKVDKRDIEIGVWYLSPTSKCFENLSDDLVMKGIQNAQEPIILYCHGNSNHRAAPNRVVMYKLLQSLNYHVVAFDYRGYGDSTSTVPSEKGVVEDTFQVYVWLMKSLKGNSDGKIVMWGHSLGSSVASHMVSQLDSLCDERGMPRLSPPFAIVLESPFNNLQDEVERHPASKIMSWMPHFKSAFVKPLASYKFSTDEYLKSVPNIPVLMLHTEGDWVVPIDLAKRLHASISESRKGVEGAAPVVFHKFPRCRRLGHNNLCIAEALPGVVKDFMQLCENCNKPELKVTKDNKEPQS